YRIIIHRWNRQRATITALENLPDDIRARGHVRERIVSKRITRRRRLARIERVVVIRIEIHDPAGDRVVGRVFESVGIFVVEDGAVDRARAGLAEAEVIHVSDTFAAGGDEVDTVHAVGRGDGRALRVVDELRPVGFGGDDGDVGDRGAGRAVEMRDDVAVGV